MIKHVLLRIDANSTDHAYRDASNEEMSTPAAHATIVEIGLVVDADPVYVAGCTTVPLPAMLVVATAAPEALPVSAGLPVDFALAALLAEPPATTGPVDAGFVFA